MTLKNQLTHLHTPLGIRPLEDSVAYCNRCGMCASACPTYQTTRLEAFSPRGRNQALRMLLEGKLHPRHQLWELEPLVRSCLLCGKCTQNCPGQIPTAEHVLELGRRLKIALLPNLLQRFLKLRAARPVLFYYAVRSACVLHQAGLLRWGTVLPGLGFLKEIDHWFPHAWQPPFRPDSCEQPTLFYLPSLEATYLCPDIARQVYALASKKNRVRVWQHQPSGLFEYVYGDIRLSRKQVRHLITLHEQEGNQLPVLTDSIDVYHFLKNAPQLFEGFQHWEEKSAQFARQVRFITDIFPAKILSKSRFTGPVTLMPTALFDTGSAPLLQAEEILHTLFKKNFVKFGYRDAAVAPAGYGLYRNMANQANSLQAVRNLAKHRIQTVFVPSVFARQMLQAQLSRFYPSARVCHLVELNG